jgi:PEP-CTERM motif
MHKTVIGFRLSGLTLLASAVLFSPMSWAGTGSCTTTKELSAFGATSDANGCYEIDQTFSNFNVANGPGSSITQGMGTVDITGSSSWASDTTPWTTTATYSGNTGVNTAAPWTTSGPSSFVEGTITGITNTTATEFSPPGYPTPGGSESILIDNASLSAIGLTGSGMGDSITITESFCVGTAACTTGPSGDTITLKATFSGPNDSTATYSCSTLADSHAACGGGISTTPITVTFTTPVPTLNVSDTYALVEGNWSNADALASFSNTFGNEETAPEPSTFILLGTALVGIGLLRARRKSA